ncbi:hypothetical protein GGR50DRAFT_646327 [Xylaria sp. CBS 124048]|nr:hypothetical protein GGR50DRAFT_646327 [Xylaria sp. CBS 124048]
MLTSIIVPRPRPLRLHLALNKGIALSNAFATSPHHRSQTRAFRFGIWSSCLDGSHRHELRRRWRLLKHDNANAGNKRVPWLDHPLPEEPDITLKRTVDAWYRSRWMDLNQSDADRPSSAVFAFGAESWKSSLERSYMDKINCRRYRQNRSNMKSQDEVNMKPEHSTPSGTSTTSQSHNAIQPEINDTVQQDYVIDPITNRKVLKSEPRAPETESGPTTRTSETFAASNPEQKTPPVHSNGKPPESELNKYCENDFNDWSFADNQLPSDSTEYPAQQGAASAGFDGSTLKSEEYALNHLPPEDVIEENEDHQNQNATPDEASREPGVISNRDDAINELNFSDISHDRSVPEGDKLQAELGKYGPYMYGQNSTDDIPEKPNDLGKYQYRASETKEHSVEQPTEYDDLYKYEPAVFDEIKSDNQSSEKYEELEKYQALEHQTPNATEPLERDIVAECLKEYEGKEQHDGISDGDDSVPEDISRMERVEGRVFPCYLPNWKDDNNAHSSGDIVESREEMHRSMNEISETSDAMDHEIISNLRSKLQSRQHDQIMESSQSSPDESALASSEQSQEQSQEVQRLNQNVEHETAPQHALDPSRSSDRSESALNRHVSAAEGDPPNPAFTEDLYSKEPQGLETSYFEECGGKHTMPIYTKTYGNEPGQVVAGSKPEGHQPSNSSSDSYYNRDPEVDGIPWLDSKEPTRNRGTKQLEFPTVYKVLAYDPTWQSISVAETTSVIPDLASPLSPTEVLPRLTNPAKFVPYFSPLQAEGFEIVSGGGNILVFRQARPGKATTRGGATVNPIDMMGLPAAVPNAAAFVSPTGFVNYDTPQVEEEAAESFHRSNTYVRREEPVFSGHKSASEGAKKKKPRLRKTKRVLIGGAGIVGITYAYGVVKEYFTTGGADGKGPTGFSPI